MENQEKFVEMQKKALVRLSESLKGYDYVGATFFYGNAKDKNKKPLSAVILRGDKVSEDILKEFPFKLLVSYFVLMFAECGIPKDVAEGLFTEEFIRSVIDKAYESISTTEHPFDNNFS